MIQFKKLDMIKYINNDNVLIEIDNLKEIDTQAINEFIKNNEIKTILNFKGVIK